MVSHSSSLILTHIFDVYLRKKDERLYQPNPNFLLIINSNAILLINYEVSDTPCQMKKITPFSDL